MNSKPSTLKLSSPLSPRNQRKRRTSPVKVTKRKSPAKPKPKRVTKAKTTKAKAKPKATKSKKSPKKVVGKQPTINKKLTWHEFIKAYKGHTKPDGSGYTFSDLSPLFAAHKANFS